MKIISAVILGELDDGKGIRQIYINDLQKEALVSFIYSGNIGSPVQISEKVLDGISIKSNDNS